MTRSRCKDADLSRNRIDLSPHNSDRWPAARGRRKLREQHLKQSSAGELVAGEGRPALQKEFRLIDIHKILLSPTKHFARMRRGGPMRVLVGLLPKTLAKDCDRDLADFLQCVELFEDLEIGDLRQLARLVHERSYWDGDRGCQFTPGKYQQFLGTHPITCSMSAVGSCADNAAAESFFGVLKRERVNRRQYRARAQARRISLTTWNAATIPAAAATDVSAAEGEILNPTVRGNGVEPDCGGCR